MTEWSSDIVPRDTDPVSRSVLGYIESQKTADFSDSLFIIPSSSDSMRKIASHLMDRGKKVYMIDIPPVKDNPVAWKRCEEIIRELCDRLTDHTGKAFSKRRYCKAAELVDEARVQMARFLKRTRLYPDILSTTARMLVQNSYYYTNDLQSWTGKLTELNDEIKLFSVYFSKDTNIKEVFEDTCDLRNIIRENKVIPKVLLVGSPIYFPNYKVPKLIEDSGMEICEVVENSTHKLKKRTFDGGNIKRGSILSGIAKRWYFNDISSAFVVNSSMLKGLMKTVDMIKPQGIICHVLKGQIEYDFELIRIEKQLEKMDIPVFRLETDYKNNDVEQLRIRMEAFSEMLKNRVWCAE